MSRAPGPERGGDSCDREVSGTPACGLNPGDSRSLRLHLPLPCFSVVPHLYPVLTVLWGARHSGQHTDSQQTSFAAIHVHNSTREVRFGALQPGYSHAVCGIRAEGGEVRGRPRSAWSPATPHAGLAITPQFLPQKNRDANERLPLLRRRRELQAQVCEPLPAQTVLAFRRRRSVRDTASKPRAPRSHAVLTAGPRGRSRASQEPKRLFLQT
ncbi:hypothetical protein SKAU_G00202500 [Synaphobranchus kaupii]|uniref:Uncharacterized protein n=1 Tax=Synaphobranchus kaupii TaxID=118154 RepID=A0A9Q1FFV2_SYNKA|nr:hypothetical protein SKAU_G00202500 [Synaphobranchus kaupii]